MGIGDPSKGHLGGCGWGLKTILWVITGSEKCPHELVFFRRWVSLASGVELLVQEVHNGHVVVDVQVVEEGLADLRIVEVGYYVQKHTY